MSVPREIAALHRAEQRLVRTVDSLSAPQWSAPSLLPDWSRAHVVAHLALNAEALARAVDGVRHGRSVPLYASNASRDADIAVLAVADPEQIRERLFAAGQHLRDLFESLDEAHWQGTVPRLPEGPAWPTSSLVATRWREVEIHHADLGLEYGPARWDQDFVVSLLDQVIVDHADSSATPGFALKATDLDRTWSVGADEPVVRGLAADLGWWLVGRGGGAGLTCSSGALPELGPWRRSPRS